MSDEITGITVPELDEVQKAQAGDCLMLTHTDGTTDKIKADNFSTKIPVYDTIEDAEDDLDNLDDGQIIGTVDDGADELLKVVDTVEDNNMHPVTSNAVFQMVKTVEVTKTTGADGMMWGVFSGIDPKKVISILVKNNTGLNATAIIFNAKISPTTYGVKIIGDNANSLDPIANKSVTIDVTYLDV